MSCRLWLRLAVDRKDQGSGLGKDLLRDAILRSVEASDIIGVRALLVHALNDTARACYAHFDFEPSPTDPLHLLLLVKDWCAGRELGFGRSEAPHQVRRATRA